MNSWGHPAAPKWPEGSAIGARYRHSMPKMEARVIAAIEQRLELLTSRRAPADQRR